MKTCFVRNYKYRLKCAYANFKGYGVFQNPFMRVALPDSKPSPPYNQNL